MSSSETLWVVNGLWLLYVILALHVDRLDIQAARARADWWKSQAMRLAEHYGLEKRG